MKVKTHQKQYTKPFLNIVKDAKGNTLYQVYDMHGNSHYDIFYVNAIKTFRVFNSEYEQIIQEDDSKSKFFESESIKPIDRLDMQLPLDKILLCKTIEKKADEEPASLGDAAIIKKEPTLFSRLKSALLFDEKKPERHEYNAPFSGEVKTLGKSGAFIVKASAAGDEQDDEEDVSGFLF